MTQLDAIASLVRGVLGDDLVGAYLHGSAVLGQLRPRSDTDVLVVSRRRLADEERRILVEGLMDISGRRARTGGPARPIELTIVVQADVRPWRYPPRSEFQYGEWLRDEYERGVVPTPGESPDLAPILAMVLLGDRPILGPPPGEVLDPVPNEDLVRAVVAGIPGLLDDLEPDTANVVLTLARIWTTVATGDLRAKDAAADWALARLPEEHRPVLERARAIYLGEIQDEDMTDLWPRVQAHTNHVVREIERALAGTTAANPTLAAANPDVPPARRTLRERRPISFAALMGAILVVAAAVLLTMRGSEGSVGKATAGDFVLELHSSRSTYESGVPISVDASLTYVGGEPSIHIVHGQPLFGFGVREPVLGERLSPVVQAVRSGSTLVRGVPLTARFAKSGGWLSPPGPSFIAYIEDPVFWLPAGSWKVYVTTQFQDQAGGPDVVLTASVTLEVRPLSTPEGS